MENSNQKLGNSQFVAISAEEAKLLRYYRIADACSRRAIIICALHLAYGATISAGNVIPFYPD